MPHLNIFKDLSISIPRVIISLIAVRNRPSKRVSIDYSPKSLFLVLWKDQRKNNDRKLPSSTFHHLLGYDAIVLGKLSEKRICCII